MTLNTYQKYKELLPTFEFIFSNLVKSLNGVDYKESSNEKCYMVRLLELLIVSLRNDNYNEFEVIEPRLHDTIQSLLKDVVH